MTADMFDVSDAFAARIGGLDVKTWRHFKRTGRAGQPRTQYRCERVAEALRALASVAAELAVR